MVYVCLLRGVNVGGNNLVSMKELSHVLLEKGFTHVKTYINSGNIIFESSKSKTQCEDEIHQLILDIFQVDSKVLVLSKDEMTQVVKMIPSHFQNDDNFKSDVLFYYPNFNHDWIKVFHFREGIDEVVLLNNALIHGTLRINQTKSALMKIIGTELYFHVTIRNVNTARKLVDILNLEYN